MKNRIDISTDGINAYAKIEVKASKTGIRILGVLIFLELIIFVGLLLQIDADDFFSMVIPIIIILTLFVGLPVKYLLWNMYGNEELIVNTKSISWSYDYGFFKKN